jgi:hypothetical protein
VIRYTASRTLAAFHRCPEFARLIVGPIGSGKSSGSVMDIFRHINTARPGHDGMRRSRWLVARNSYRELRDTTIKTWRQWIPEGIGVMHASDFQHVIRSSDVDAEILFRSFDTPEDARKLLSLELTGAWLNEAREFPRAIFDMASGRVGRYPSATQGAPAWFGVILDSNPSDRMHWCFNLFAEQRPPGFALFQQPSGTAPDAENLANLPPGYYERLAAGKAQDWIDVYVHGRWGFTQSGRPVFPEFADRVHVTAEALTWRPGEDLVIGLDHGLTPAAVMLQQRPSGGWDCIAELTSERSGAVQFAEELQRFVARHHRSSSSRVWGDPAGGQAAQTDEQTVHQVMQQAGVNVIPAPSNSFPLRRETVGRLLRTLAPDGLPALRISPECQMLRNGLGGGYYYRKIAVSGADDRLREQPEKNHYSHVCEALQYAMLGEGEGWDLLGAKRPAPDYSALRRAAI